MWSTRTVNGLLVRAPAKVNLFLEVLGKRPDGYHDLATLMVAVGLYDTLEFKEDRSTAFGLDLAPRPEDPAGEDRPSLATGPENLIWRAAELLRQRTGCAGGARVRLHKRIPLAAGLAGGSSDAAATLLGLNRLWRLGLRRDELAALGAELGSDVPFFFAAPAAWCTGRGEVVEPLRPGRPLWLVLACPPVGLSTAAVFRALAPPEAPVDGAALRRAVEVGDVDEAGRRLFNRLQPVAEALCPPVAAAARVLARYPRRGCGAGSLMSGSGTTLFVLCRGPAEAQRIARELVPSARERGIARAYVVRSCL
jgi:4-diphosphocytidyl-2-C-methyl-D-erythritol kinase